MSGTVLLIGACAVITAAIKAAGPVALGGRDLPVAFRSVIALFAPALFAALIVTQALADPSNTVVVKAGRGAPVVTDGPFIESKEFMGGFYLVEVESKERAVELAKMIPDVRHDGFAIEVRPVMFSAGLEM